MGKLELCAVKISTQAQLVQLVNRLNAEWLLAMPRTSPQVLRELLAFCGPEVEACFSSLDSMKMGGTVS